MESLNIDQKIIAWLNSAHNISNKRIQAILSYFNDNPKDVWDNFAKENSYLKLDSEAVNYLIKSKDNFEESFIKRLKSENSQIVTLLDEDYPKKLKEIEDPPYILYYKGSLKSINNLSIAVVGSRKATSYGKWAAEKFTAELSAFGVNIISGLAFGIDAIAHKTALKSNATTIGVIGCGIDIIYPKSNEHLYGEIAEKSGAVITEYPFGMQPLPNNFHARNRIISGLSNGVLVIEAQERSGTLITAGHAANQGREIFAVPGNIDSLYSKGTNALIKDGAKITTSINDIIEEIIELKEKVKQKQSCIDCSNLTDDEMEIVRSLKTGIKTIYELNEETNMEIGSLLSLLTMLEMKGIVNQIALNKFIINSKV